MINTYFTKEQVTRFRKEHIIKGDKGDGVPNFLSADDCIVTKTKQKSIFEVKVDVWVTQEPEEFCDEQQLKNYYRNKKLVDLSQIPESVTAAIIEEYDKPSPNVGRHDKIFPYFIKFKMKNLLELIRDF